MRHVLVILVLLAGCATPYQPRSIFGGYSETRLDSETFLVSFEGNGSTSVETVALYLHRRCAEVTVEAGYEWFVRLDGGVNTSTVFTSSYSRNGGAMMAASYPTATATIRCGHGPRPDRGFTAREVLAYLVPNGTQPPGAKQQSVPAVTCVPGQPGCGLGSADE